ncbi:DUF106 domain-containing protein [Archaeoglobus veneficus]|uniref:DUF106 domain-containing protein n=1 Tax=Archaeoglobus veneficus (strain DSM 11195 / SNP6) TaxID=693661 RepID=F2KSS7_ARCVS|nr:EMC3/TMCO1 family protein [Archaeoglobus veneficus]AEA46972.1 protein of unknown function DUF106 transmembrane [Archaeoglobus veneficus SNP6]
MKGKLKQVVDSLLIGLGLLFMFGVFSADFRYSLANSVAPLLDPLLALPIHVVIFILASITATYSSIIQKYAVDMQKFKEIHEKVLAFQKEYMEAMKQNNQYKLKKLEEKRPEIQKLQGEMMGMQFRSMFYTVVVTLPIFYWLWVRIYDITPEVHYKGYYGLESKFMVTVPFSGTIHVSEPIFILPWWIFWYFMCSVLLSQFIKKVFKLG